MAAATPTAPYCTAHNGKVWVMSGNPIGQNGPAPNGLAAAGQTWTYTPGANAWEPGLDFPTGQAWGGII
jgi:hypothetical protein